MHIVGITGRKGAGKDTFAQVFVNHDYTLLRFADPLKNMARALLKSAGFKKDEIERYVEGDWKEHALPELAGKSMREIMQTLGTEWGRNLFGEDFWVDILRGKLVKMVRLGITRFVIPDMRFENECRMLAGQNATLIRIERPGLPGNEFSAHASEQEIGRLPVHHVVQNVTNIRDLQDRAYGYVRCSK